jgi:hypothetical protein
MIISASRRTDIPAFYSEWFMNRVRAGHCAVVNPYNRRQVRPVSLASADVDALVFWTRWPEPLMPHLDELEEAGLGSYCFLFTITGYGVPLEAEGMAVERQVACFQRLARRLGPLRVTWRYDPIVVAEAFPPSYHLEQFNRLADQLQAHTPRVVVSVVTNYRKTERRLGSLGPEYQPASWPAEQTTALLHQLAHTAEQRQLPLEVCCSPADAGELGLVQARCIDVDLLSRAFNRSFSARKDPGQRRECRCAVSRDIGATNSCLFGCAYCYATVSQRAALGNHQRHDPAAPALLGGALP